jgi:7-carboxy-7-deazaguanine synthase
MLVVNEIFFSLQGESTHAGRPCVFVRLSYCNLRCAYCDTAYAFEAGEDMTVEDVVGKVKAYRCNLVEITGGEPLLQPEVHKLMMILCDEGMEVLLETSGSIDISVVDPRVKRIVDFKCPSSGMEKRNIWDNIHYIRENDEVKFVIGTREDYEWAKNMISKYNMTARCSVLMGVAFAVLEPRILAEWILADDLPVRYQLQIHKYIWPPDSRGV